MAPPVSFPSPVLSQWLQETKYSLVTQAIVPTLETAADVIARTRNTEFPPNLLPLTASIPADLLTPTLAYLKISEK